jgi:hypothetical protein
VVPPPGQDYLLNAAPYRTGAQQGPAIRGTQCHIGANPPNEADRVRQPGQSSDQSRSPAECARKMLYRTPLCSVEP